MGMEGVCGYGCEEVCLCWEVGVGNGGSVWVWV